MSSTTFPAGGGSTSLLERKVQNMLHRDVDGVKVQRSQQHSFSHSRNNTLINLPNPNAVNITPATTTTPTPAPSQPPTNLSTPTTRPSHLALPEPAAGDESPLSITRRQSSMQLNRRDLTDISDDEEVGVAQYNGNGRSGWRGRPSASSVAPLPPGEHVLERTQSMSVLSPLPEVSMERGLSERQLSITAPKRAQTISTSNTVHPAPMPPLPTPKLVSSLTATSSNPLPTHPRFKTRAPIRSWKERPQPLQAKDELLRTARRYGSGLAGEGAEAVKARKRAMMEEKEEERVRGTLGSGGDKDEEERKEGRIAGSGGDFSGMGSRRRYDDDDDAAPNNRVLSWLRHDNNIMKGSNLHPADSISVSEDDGDDRQGRKVKSTVDRLQASLSKGRRKVIGIPSKLREMMSLHPKGAGKGEKEDGKEERKGEEEDSEDSQKDRQGIAAIGLESRVGSASGDERRDLIATTESAMLLNAHSSQPSSSVSSTPPIDPSTNYAASSTSADNPPNAHSNNDYNTSTHYDDDMQPLRVDVSVLDRPSFASAPPTHRSPPIRNSPPAFAPSHHRRSRSIDSTHAYTKPPTPDPSLSPRTRAAAAADDSLPSSATSSTMSSRRSSLSHDNAVHSASFDSLPTLRTKSALGGKGSVGFVGSGGRTMRARERFNSTFEGEREEKRAMDAEIASDAASDSDMLPASQHTSPISSSKLSDLYSLQQQHIALLEAQIAELSSSHDSLRQQLDDTNRTRTGRVDWDNRLDALEQHMEKIKQSQNRQFRAIYEQLNEVRGSGGGGVGGGGGVFGGGGLGGLGGSGWVWDVLLNVFTWFVTGLAFVSQPFTYLLSGRLGGWWGASNTGSGGKGKRTAPVPKISGVNGSGTAHAAASASSSPTLVALAASHDRSGRDDGHRDTHRERDHNRDSHGHRERERSSRVTERVGGGGRRHEVREVSAERNRSGERDRDRDGREWRNRSRDMLDVTNPSGRREGRGSRELHMYG